MTNESKQLLHDCVVEFVGFVTSEASELVGNSSRRKLVTANDYLLAMDTLGMHDYTSVLKTYLENY